jgi:hypothetical protein
MADGTDTSKNNSGSDNGTNDTTKNEPRKFSFDADEQDFIQGLIDKAVGKVHKKYETQINELNTKLETGSKKGDGHSDDQADGANKAKGKEDAVDQKQFRELLEAEKAKTKNAELLAKAKEKEAADAAAEAMRIRKEVAISRAASKQNFYELDVVMKMTQDSIEWDDETKKFVVKENGIIKQNSSLEPMSLEEYFSSFAAQRPYLVNGDVKGGAGSSESKSNSAGLVKTKADLKTAKEKSDFITKFGLGKYEALPLK